MTGKKKRDDTADLRKGLEAAHFKNAIWRKAANERANRRARLRGLAS
jgi:hypothetical protein